MIGENTLLRENCWRRIGEGNIPIGRDDAMRYIRINLKLMKT
jgi:hypothetical protein